MNTELYFLKGKYKLETVPHELKMSHWVYTPILTEAESDKKVLDLIGSTWDLRSAKESFDSIILMLASYPEGDRIHELKLLPSKGEAILNGKLMQISNVREALYAIA